MKKIIPFILIIFCIYKTQAQQTKWIISSGEVDINGNQNTFGPGNLKFYEMDFSGASPVITPRTIGGSIINKKSYGTSGFINSIIDYKTGNIAFYIFVNSPNVFNDMTLNTNDTLWIVMPDSNTGKDEIIGVANSLKLGRSIQESAICPVPHSQDKYYVIYKTSATNSILGNVEYVTVNTSTRTVSAPIVIQANDRLNEGFALSKLISNDLQNCYARWLITVKDSSTFLLIQRSTITASGISAPVIIDRVNTNSTTKGGQGEIEFSNSGNKLAICNWDASTSQQSDLLIYDFSLTNGSVSNLRKVYATYGPILSCEFSPDELSVYALQTGSWVLPSAIWHFNLPAANTTYALASNDSIANWNPYIRLQLIEQAHDGSMYLTSDWNALDYYQITNPNSLLAFPVNAYFPNNLVISQLFPDEINGEDYTNRCDITGENQIDKNTFSLNIYPSPVESNLTIDNNYNSVLNFSITNILGQSIFSNTLYNGKNVIDVNDLTAGVYFLIANNNKGTIKSYKFEKK